jgi:hypothetical protein
LTHYRARRWKLLGAMCVVFAVLLAIGHNMSAAVLLVIMGALLLWRGRGAVK